MAGLDFYPLEERPEEVLRTFSVQVPQTLAEDLAFIADLWNAFDSALEKKERTKWKQASVIRQLLLVSRDVLAEQIGGMPRTEEERAEFIKNAASVVGRLKAAKKKK